ncbi:MAG: UDP-N-acetylmuramoyl-tripeptide--D-alanyl-D-alanine ligase [Bacilli bacterium]|nr:UDP-N-acetylmuramoyl-tripeptide--D-alanyl-D-alanine ligase [Bacilli bacterium]
MNEFLFSLMPYFFYTLFKYRKSMYMLQQNSYNESNRYLKWIFKNTSKTFSSYEIFIFSVLIITIVLVDKYFAINLLVYTTAFVIELKHAKVEQKKKKFVITSRIKRLMLTIFILFGVMIYFVYINYDKMGLVTISSIFFMFSFLSYVITYIANLINKPIELMVFNYYLKSAKEKLKDRPNLKVIGVTGSYGKTSSKNILNDILNSKYISFTTPKSFNTPNGIMKTINNDLDKFTEMFVVEMGACKLGDIKELCDIVHPKYGIITSIGLAHLETFKSEENIQKGKFELIESLPSDGIAVLNKDDANQVSYKLKNKCKIIWIGIDNKDADIYASDIKMSNNGLVFNIIIKKKKYKFETTLLGKHNVYNILGAVALGLEFGIDIENLQRAVKKLKPIEHRLELKEQNGIYIIDDAYNSNPVGAKSALEVLDMMPGKKIVVTPGMIELGEKEYKLNMEFGMEIAKVADEVILVGKKQTEPILDGLLSMEYNEEKIHIINNVKEAYLLLNELKGKSTYALFENDLLDTFNEV